MSGHTKKNLEIVSPFSLTYLILVINSSFLKIFMYLSERVHASTSKGAGAGRSKKQTPR